MNIVMVNPVHPDTPHISGVRAACFALELAALGHRVILLTAPLAGRAATTVVQLSEHDWARPLLLEVETPARKSRYLPVPLRKLLTAGRMLVSGGSQGTWVSNAVRYMANLRSEFRPDVVWCTFGKLEAVVAARRISLDVGCPWVLDIKDNWELYVPVGIRRLMAWRIRGWSAITVNAEFNAQMARKWLWAESNIIYSGIDNSLLGTKIEPYDSSSNYIAIVGSLYSTCHLEILLCGIKKWLNSLEPQVKEDICIKYLGGDTVMFNAAARECLPGRRTEVLGYLPVSQMADVCRSAVANLYVCHSGTFHHKLLELLACQRPLIVCPGESEESRRLVKQVGGLLYEAATVSQVSDSLTLAFSQTQNLDPRARENGSNIEEFSWPQQALKLDAILSDLFKG